MADQYDDVNTPVIAVVGLLGAIILFAIVLALTVLYYHADARQKAERNSGEPAELSNLIAKQQADLASYRWVNEKKGSVAIPISRAKELVLEEAIAKEGYMRTPLRIMVCPPQRPGLYPTDYGINAQGHLYIPGALPESGVLADPVDEENEQRENEESPKSEEENNAS